MGRSYDLLDAETQIEELEVINAKLLEACKFTLLCINENWTDLSNAEVMLRQAISRQEGA